MLTNCPACGAGVQAGWKHCGSCGASLSVEEAEHGAPRLALLGRVGRLGRLGRGIDWRRPGTLVALAIAVLLLASLAGLSAQRRSNERADDLASTQRSLADTKALLDTVRVELADRVKERDTLRSDLDKTKGSLTDAQRSVESQNQQLQTLKDCLNAIVDAGEALDRGDEQAARTAVTRAQRSCSQAEAFL